MSHPDRNRLIVQFGVKAWDRASESGGPGHCPRCGGAPKKRVKVPSREHGSADTVEVLVPVQDGHTFLPCCCTLPGSREDITPVEEPAEAPYHATDDRPLPPVTTLAGRLARRGIFLPDVGPKTEPSTMRPSSRSMKELRK